MYQLNRNKGYNVKNYESIGYNFIGVDAVYSIIGGVFLTNRIVPNNGRVGTPVSYYFNFQANKKSLSDTCLKGFCID